MEEDGIETPASLAAFGVSMRDVLAAVRERVDGFAALPLTALSARPLSGGMSNLMFAVSAPAAAPAAGGSGSGGECCGGLAPWAGAAAPSAEAAVETEVLAASPGAPTRTPVVTRVVARILSPQLDAIIDRMREHQIVSYLSTTGIGPRLFGTAAIRPPAGGPSLLLRIEEFIEGRTLTVGDLRHNLAAGESMARKVARLHAQRPALRRHESYPGVEPAEFPVPVPLPASVRLDNTLEGTLRRYVLLAGAIADAPVSSAASPAAAAELRALLAALPWLAEVEWLVALLEAHGGPTVLAHCDLQEGNWMQCTSTGKLYMIDYEYACYNFRAFDLGNLYCEHTFDYTCDTPPGYTHELAYPSLAWQRAILAQYAAQASRLAHAAAHHPVHATRRSSVPDPAALGTGDEASRGPDVPADAAEARLRTTLAPDALAAAFPGDDDDDVRSLASEARVGILASHLYWALWSIVMGAGKLGIVPRLPPAVVDAAAAAAAAMPPSPATFDRPAAGTPPPPQVATGHSVFSYGHYGATRAAEYLRLKAELLADVPAWFAPAS